MFVEKKESESMQMQLLIIWQAMEMICFQPIAQEEIIGVLKIPVVDHLFGHKVLPIKTGKSQIADQGWRHLQFPMDPMTSIVQDL